MEKGSICPPHVNRSVAEETEDVQKPCLCIAHIPLLIFNQGSMIVVSGNYLAS